MTSGLTWLEILSLAFSGFCLLRFLDKLGKEISIVHAIALITCIMYLVMPVVAYRIYNEYNSLAKLFQTVMPISSREYFSFALPATVAMIVGLNWPFNGKRNLNDHQLLQRTETFLRGKQLVGIIFILIGLVCGFLVKVAPESIKAILYFGNQLFFVGIFYLLFSPIRYKAIVAGMAILMLLIQTVNTGMYGELVFWSLLILIFLLMKLHHIRLSLKILLVIFGVYGIMFIQSIKQEYRDQTWFRNTQKADVAYFWRLIMERFSEPTSIFQPKRLHAMATRGNQGFLLARTMEYVPRREPFARGETIVNAVKASVVPRFIWKDKPRLGGLENTCRFLGDCSKRYYSYNIGQIGEAYVNFGETGGIVFMFFFGFFIKWMLHKMRVISQRIPSLILWIPLLFYSSLAMETDILTFLNSFIKGVLFCFMVFLFFRYVLKWKI